MIRNRPDIARRFGAMRVRARGGLGIRSQRRGPRPVWPWRVGAGVLVCWEGERLPYPTLDPVGSRPAHVIGLAPGLSGNAETFADVTFTEGVYHFAVITIGPGGVPSAIDPVEVQTRVFDSADLLVGLLPNVPALVQARRLPGDKPHVTWVHSRISEQVATDHFDVYARDEETDFDFDSPVGQVTFETDRTRYGWTGAALSGGDARYYTVRSVSAGGVKSLIPRNGRAPSPVYDSVGQGFCAWLEIPAGPPSDAGTLGIEVFDEL